MALSRHVVISLLAAGAWLQPGEALAHSLSERFGDFYGGLLHPLTSLEIGLGFLSIAIVVGQQGKRGARCMLGWFLGALGAGVLAGPMLPELESEIRVSGVVAATSMGILAAAALRLPGALVPLCGLSLGALFGIGNGLAMTTQTSAHLFVAGVLAGALLVVTPVAAFVTTLDQRWQLTAVRIIGSWIAASGLLIIAFHLRGVIALNQSLS